VTSRISTAELVALLDAPREWVLESREHGTLRYALLMAASYRAEGVRGHQLATADGALRIDEEQLIELLRVTGLGRKRR